MTAWATANLQMLAIIFSALLMTGAIVTYSAATRLSRRAAAGPATPFAAPPMLPVERPAAIGARGAAVAIERSVSDFSGSVAGAETPPLVAVIGSPGSEVGGAVDAAASGAPVDLVTHVSLDGLAQTVMTAQGAILNFGDELLVREDWRAAWRATLVGLRARRPDRPLDGIVFAIRAQVLPRLDGEHPGALSELGERFGALLQEAQAIGGLRLPIYLLITGVEDHPGFATLWQAAKDAGTDSAIIGWSAPGSPENQWDTALLDTAIASISASLDGLALAALAAHPGARSESMLDMSSLAQAFTGPLRALLTPMLRPTAFADPMMFRGIYLLGTARGERAAFAADVFSKKIFAESRLARPARGMLTQRARRARRLKFVAAGTAALGGVGMFLLTLQNGAQNDLLSLLSVIDRSVTESRELESQGLTVSQEMLNQDTREIFNAMSTLTINTLPTVLAPTTFLSPIERRVERAVATGLNEVPLRALRDGLHSRFSGILSASRKHGALDAAKIAELADGLEKLDETIAIYEGLRESRTADDLAELSNYAIGFPPPSGFSDAYEIYVRALSRTDAPKIDRSAMQPELVAALGEPDDGVFAAAYLRTPLFETLSRIEDDAAWLLTDSADGNADVVGRLNALIRNIDHAEALLADPEQNWLDSHDGPLDESLRRSAAIIAGLSFAPPDLRVRLDDEIEASENQASLTVQQLVGFAGRGIVQAGPDGTRLHPMYPKLRAAAAALLEDGRLAQASPSVDQRPGDAARMSWDPFRLKEAAATASWLLGAVTNSMGDFPPDLREQMIAVVRGRTESRIVALVEEARRPLGGGQRDATRQEATAFAAAAPLLAQLHDQAALLGLQTLQQQIARVADVQAERLLTEIDAMLQEAAPYAAYLPGIDTWDGETQSAAAMFGLFGDAELAGVLRQWRGFMQLLGEQQAAPIVDYFSGSLEASPSVAAITARWRDILATLSDYAARSPRNALTELERFILVGMNELDHENCAERLAGARAGAGWFGDRMSRLVRAVQFRCEDISSTHALVAQWDLEDAFDAQLAGRFPFIGVGGGAPLADPSRAADAADPESVRRFFTTHGPEIARIAAGADAPAITYQGERAREFTAALADVAAFLGGPDGAPPPGGSAYAVNFTFRTNRDRERAGEQIVEWSAEIGADRLSSFEPSRALIWRQGDPITLRFRWARNAPNLPGKPRRTDASVEDRTLTLRYDDRWSLITMVAANAPGGADLRTLGDPRPNVLRVAAPLLGNSAAATGATSFEQAEIYLRVEIRALDESGRQATGPALRMPVFPGSGAFQ